MNVFDFAMGIETEGIALYTDLAAKTPLREMAGIFEFFLREEKRHYEIFSAWKKNLKAPDMETINLKEKVQEVFEKLSRNLVAAGIPAIDHEDAYKKALSLENQSVAYYESVEAETGDQNQRDVLHLVVLQERTHIAIINQLMEFQRHPNEWLENAEWNHLDEF